MEQNPEGMRILEMIERGEINASEGLRLIQISNARDELDQAVSPPGEAVGSTELQNFKTGEYQPGSSNETEVLSTASVPGSPPVEKLRLYWMIPLWIGAGITMLGGAFMYWALQAAGISFWLFLASLPFFLGVLVMALARQSRDGHWLHLHIEQKPGEWPHQISFSLPLPLRLTAWFLRNFGDRIPSLKGTALDEVILALGSTTTVENPIYMEINDDKDGERVLILIT